MLRKQLPIALAALVLALGVAGLGFSEEKKVVTKQCGKCCDIEEVEKGKAPAQPSLPEKDDDTHRFGGG